MQCCSLKLCSIQGGCWPLQHYFSQRLVSKTPMSPVLSSLVAHLVSLWNPTNQLLENLLKLNFAWVWPALVCLACAVVAFCESIRMESGEWSKKNNYSEGFSPGGAFLLLPMGKGNFEQSLHWGGEDTRGLYCQMYCWIAAKSTGFYSRGTVSFLVSQPQDKLLPAVWASASYFTCESGLSSGCSYSQLLYFSSQYGGVWEIYGNPLCILWKVQEYAEKAVFDGTWLHLESNPLLLSIGVMVVPYLTDKWADL